MNVNMSVNECNVVAKGLPRAVKYLKDTERSLQSTSRRDRGSRADRVGVAVTCTSKNNNSDNNKGTRHGFDATKIPSVNLNSRTLDAAQTEGVKGERRSDCERKKERKDCETSSQLKYTLGKVIQL